MGLLYKYEEGGNLDKEPTQEEAQSIVDSRMKELSGILYKPSGVNAWGFNNLSNQADPMAVVGGGLNVKGVGAQAIHVRPKDYNPYFKGVTTAGLTKSLGSTNVGGGVNYLHGHGVIGPYISAGYNKNGFNVNTNVGYNTLDRSFNPRVEAGYQKGNIALRGTLEGGQNVARPGVNLSYSKRF